MNAQLPALSVAPPLNAFESEEFDGRFSFRLATSATAVAIEAALRTAGDVDTVLVSQEEVRTARTEALVTEAGRSRHLRVDLRRLDMLMDLIGGLVTVRGRLNDLAARRRDVAMDDLAVQISRLSTDLRNVLEHPEWEDVAKRCLACANCTMVCPTGFCHTVEDRTDFSGEHMERRRRWDTCFTGEFSYIHGGSIRPSVRARYRHWLLHKFSNWVDQFGSYGCVGCGRCITWCPVGIDVTEELSRLRG